MVDQKPSLAGKRIIILFGSLELGGAERQGLLLAKHLKEEQHAYVEVFGFNSPGKSASICEKEGIPWCIVPLPFSGNRFQQWFRLIRFIFALRKKRPHILLPYTMVPNVCSGIVWRWTGAQLCIWNQRDEGRERMTPKIEQRAVQKTPYFISNSQHGAQFLAQELGVNSNNIRVIHNGVNLAFPQKSKEEWKKELGADNAFLVCMIANLSPYKDWVTLFKAWKQVKKELDKKREPAFLLLAGSHNVMYSSIHKLAVDEGIDQSVLFLGRVDDISGLLNAVDLAVFSSKLEGLPNGILEAMAAGLAVVGTDIPGIREALGPEGHPYLAPPDNDKRFANLIVNFFDDVDLRRSVGEKLKQRTKNNFSPEKMCEEMVELMSDLVS